jgi:23S rRNA pseudouridine2605 synthase
VSEKLRINRFLANCGLGSRRQVESLVSSRRVSVNGEVVSDLSARIDTAKDIVQVDGKKVQPDVNEQQVWMYHKPLNCLCTRDDPKGRRTIFEDLPHLVAPFQAVGRLDQNSTGLLLITKRGDLSQALMHPKYEISKIYEVLVEGKWSRDKEKQLAQGVEMREGGEGKALVLSADSRSPSQTFLRLELRRGKKREIRYCMEALQMKVLSLHRTQLGPLKLGALKPAQSRALSDSEIQALEALF